MMAILTNSMINKINNKRKSEICKICNGRYTPSNKLTHFKTKKHRYALLLQTSNIVNLYLIKYGLLPLLDYKLFIQMKNNKKHEEFKILCYNKLNSILKDMITK